MIDLSRIFQNPFDDTRISDDRLKKFSEEHLGHLTANNPDGALDVILTPTADAHLAYFGAISNEDVGMAVRKGLTKAVDEQIDAFIKAVRKREPHIRATFTDNEPAYLSFFPQGLTGYSGATKANVETLMTRMASAASTHSDELGDAMADQFNGLLKSYKSSREAQLGKKGEVAGNKGTTAVQRATLERQLWRNVHYIAYYFDGDVDKCLAYFDQSMLRQGGSSNPAPPPVNGQEMIR